MLYVRIKKPDKEATDAGDFRVKEAPLKPISPVRRACCASNWLKFEST
jgi:hypothetical protein